MENLCLFRKALENLNNCGYCSAPVLPRLTLSRGDFQVSAYIPEEAFSSHLRCTQAAEHRLHPLLQQPHEMQRVPVSARLHQPTCRAIVYLLCKPAVL